MKKRTAALLMALILLFACMDAASAKSKKQEDVFTLSVTKVSLRVGETKKLTPTVVCNDGKHDPSALKWTSSDPDVVRVSKKGKLTALSAGKATVRVIWGDRSLKVRVTVREPAPNVTPEPSPTPEPDAGSLVLRSLMENTDQRYSAAKAPAASAKSLTSSSVYYIMGSDVCVTLPAGMVRNLSRSFGDYKAEEWIGSGKSNHVALVTFVRFSKYRSLSKWITSLEKDFNSVTSRKIGGVSCAIGYMDTQNGKAFHQTVIFNRNKVSYGIVISYASREDQANLNNILFDSMKIGSAGIRIGHPDPILYPYQSLDPELSDPDSDSAILTVSSSDRNTVEVDGNRLVAVSPGKAKITVKSSTGKKTTFSVTVLDLPAKITLARKKVYLTVGEVYQSEASLGLSPDATVDDPDWPVWKWTSSDPSVAKVNSRGLVTARKSGKAKITVTSLKLDLSASFTVQVTKAAKERDPVTYRALLIGNRDYVSGTLNGPDTDARAMNALLANTSPAYIRTLKLNRDANEILSDIRTVFASADSNDVSLFYYSGHADSYGALGGVDGSMLSPSRLAAVLKSVPGRVIVILDCCYSGTLIARSGTADIAPVSGAAVSGAVSKSVAPFRGVTVEDVWTEEASGGSVTAKSGVLRKSKFMVLASSRDDQLSHNINGDIFSGTYNGIKVGRKSVGAMTYCLLQAAGYDESSGSFISPKGTGDDNILTLKEAYSYTRSNVNRLFSGTDIVQTVTVYPSNCSEPLFTLK